MQDFISQIRGANVAPPKAKTAPSVPGAATPKQPAKSHESFEDIVNRRAEKGEETPQSEPESRLASEAETTSAEVAIEEAQTVVESPVMGISQDGHERLGDPATRATGAGEALPQEASHIAEDDLQSTDGWQPPPAIMQTDDMTAAMTRALENEELAVGQSPSDRLSRAAGRRLRPRLSRSWPEVSGTPHKMAKQLLHLLPRAAALDPRPPCPPRLGRRLIWLNSQAAKGGAQRTPRGIGRSPADQRPRQGPAR